MNRREQLLAEQMAGVTQAFAKHEITEAGEYNGLGRWLLQRRYPDGMPTSDLWTEVIEGRGGYLHVGGDISACVFGIHADRGPVGRMVYWMARTTPADSYMAEKLRIGMSWSGSFDPATEWDEKVAVEDLDQWCAERRAQAEDADDDFAREDAEEWDDLRRDILSGDYNHHDMMRRIYEWAESAKPDMETVAHWGLVPSDRIITAWGALRRLRDLLEAGR